MFVTIITGNTPTLISTFLRILAAHFAMKAIQVVRSSSGLSLSQHKYVTDLLRKFNLHTTKPVRTSLPTHTTLSHTDDTLLSDPSKNLQYSMGFTILDYDST